MNLGSKQFNIPCHCEGTWSLHPQAYSILPVTQHNLSEDQNPLNINTVETWNLAIHMYLTVFIIFHSYTFETTITGLQT
jgi:hypothetical protein